MSTMNGQSAAVEGQHSAAGGGGGGGESLVGKATHAVETGAHVLKETVQGVAHKVGQVATAAQHSGVGEAIVETAKHAVEGVKGTVTGMAEKVKRLGLLSLFLLFGSGLPDLG